MNKKYYVSKILLITLSTLLFGLTTKAQNNPVPNPPSTPQPAPQAPYHQLLGSWKAAEDFFQQGAELKSYFQFTETSMIMTGTCMFNADQVLLQVSITTPVRYFGNELHILQERHNYSGDGYHNCRLDILPAKWSFYFDGMGHPVLFTNIPYSPQITLIQE